MTLPLPLETLIATRRFWTDYYWITEPSLDDYSEESEDFELEFDVAPGCILKLEISASISDCHLAFRTPNCEDTSLGWIDGGHPIPDALRWPELSDISRAIAHRNPELPHPGLPLLLLSPFAPLCLGDDTESLTSMLAVAWEKMGFFSRAEIRDLIEHVDARYAGLFWRYEASKCGWVLEQEEGYSTVRVASSIRIADDDDFPHQEWGQFIESVRETLPIESDPAECVAHSSLTLRSQYCLDLEIPLKDQSHSLPATATKVLQDSLNRALRDLDLGFAELSGTQWGVKSWLSLLVKGDLERGVRITRDMLLWLGAPVAARLRRDGEAEQLLATRRQADGPTEIVLQFAALESVQWNALGDSGSRIDTVPMEPASRDALLARIMHQAFPPLSDEAL